MEREYDPTVIGFLTSDGLLFCSAGCARARGKTRGMEIGVNEYEALLEEGDFVPDALCPGCGGDLEILGPETTVH